MGKYTQVEKLPKVFDWKYKITITNKPNKFLKFFGFKDRENVYVGEPTVFHHYPTGSRCSTSMEYYLCELVQSNKMKSILK